MPGKRHIHDADRDPRPYDNQPARPPRTRLVRPTVAGMIFAAWVTAALHNTWLLIFGAVLVGSVLYGVVYPAVWSRSKTRQRAARRVLRDLLRWTLGRP